MSAFIQRWLSRLTLFQLFVLSVLAVTMIVGATFIFLINSSKKSILATAEKQRDAEAKRIEQSVYRELSVATKALTNIENAMRSDALPYKDAQELEAALFIEMLNNPSISDITFTHAKQEGFSESGEMLLTPDNRWQITLFRSGSLNDAHIDTRVVSEENAQFKVKMRQRPSDAKQLLNSPPFQQESDASDPTTHLTFETTTSQRNYGHTIWSDLHWSELDDMLPEAERRVVVTVQKAIKDTEGNFLGVLRIGLNTHTIDEIPTLAEQTHADEDSGKQEYRVFLTDANGHLLSRADPKDKLKVLDDDLRVEPINLDPAIAAALESKRLSDVNIDHPATDSIEVNGRPWLVSYRMLRNTQGWVVGVAVPEELYTHDLRALRDRFLWVFLATSLIGFITGGFVLRQLRRGLGSIIESTSRMRALDFTQHPIEENFRDIAEVQAELEHAKTSMRALGKYVPLDLVRNLYRNNREPVLGGELIELSILFTDIANFTPLAEKLTPDRLAEALGLYLKMMTEAVQSTGGTVDKFIGDSVMAFWNAPNPIDSHPARACRAALECMQKAEELYSSPAWIDLPPLFTRFGLHEANVMVGHFGAPDRFSYTALGDGVNLASRLEGLCKQYGVSALASETIVEKVGDEFAFRLIDKVAVKGKKEGVQVYELLGTAKDVLRWDSKRRAEITTYGIALNAYFNKEFEKAIQALSSQLDDPPSAILSERCKNLIAVSPPADWDGVYIAQLK